MTNNETTTAPSASRNGNTILELRKLDLVFAAILLIVFGWLYMPVFKWWYGVWMAKESNYSHGILIPLIFAFVVWLKRRAIAAVPIRPCAWGYAIVIPALFLVMFSAMANSASIRGMLFPILLGGFVLVLLGKAMLKELAFPILYLYFMAVLPGNLLGPASFRIQMWSTTGAATILNLIGIDAVQAGQVLTLPNGVEARVAEACSGFRLLISLFAFSVLFAYLKEGPWWGLILLVAITLPLSVFANAIRITMVCLVGQWRGAEAMHAFHDWSGYIVLLLVLMCLPFLARLFRCRDFKPMLFS
ncbi:MAG: exosortase/archaeosortase family protein [Armatimonadetes bacterium]|nr:exosortase/archaeosortase family protein [Armatimonadota bacterium]